MQAKEISTEKKSQIQASTAEVRVNHWAVFRSLRKLKSCRLTCLYTTKEQAVERARDLAAESFMAGSREFTYFVVKVEYEVGTTDGTMFDRGI